MPFRTVLLSLLLLHALSAAALEPVTLKLKWKHQFQFAGYYAAVEKGYYREAGLDVKIDELGDNTDPVADVLAGRAEFGVSSSELMLQRREHPVVVLAVILQHSPLVLLAPAREIASLHDLVGKKVMLLPQEAELYAYFIREGIAPTQIKAVAHSFDPADLISGRVDAVSGYGTDEPFLLQQQGFRHVSLTPRAAGIDFYGDNLFTTANYIKQHPKRVQAFREASLKGWRYAMEHPQELADLILSHYSQRHSREHLLFEAEEMRRLMQPDLVEIGHTNPERWQHIANTYTELGMLPPRFNLDGFIYDPDPARTPGWVMAALTASLFLIGLAAAIVWRISRMNTQLQTQLAEIKTLQSALQEQAIRDGLTALFNRRYLDETLERELAHAKREGSPLSLIMLDVDHFKRLNDTYGHAAGDKVLQALAAMLREDTRSEDVPCRFGGEEFVVLSPGMPPAVAVDRAEAWRQRFANRPIQHGELQMQVTISFGIAAYPDQGHTPDDLFQAADGALYEAKRAGRNRVCLAPSLFADQATVPKASPSP